MKVLLVNGSPHKAGCTNRALQEAAGTLNQEGIETEIFWIGNKPIGGCIGCRKCSELGKCVFDDIVNQVRNKVYEADGFIFGTPVHYGAASGNMTAFMDRLFYSEFCGNQNRGFYTIQEWQVVTSRDWTMVHGALPEQVEEDKEGLYTMRVLGKNMAYLLKCQEAAKNAGVKLPEKEAAVFTNFVR